MTNMKLYHKWYISMSDINMAQQTHTHQKQSSILSQKIGEKYDEN